MADLTEEQRKNSAASLRSIADLLDPPVASQPTSPVTPSTPATPVSTVPALIPRFVQVAFTDFPGASLPSDFYAYAHSPGNEGVGFRDPSKVAVKDGNLVITATGDTSGAVGQNVKQMHGLWEVRARFETGSGYLPCILLWPGTERDSAGKATWPSWKEYDLVECGGDRQGGNCNVHYANNSGQNTQTGPHRFDGDLTQWHVYGCELSDTGVKYYLDGKVVKELSGDNVKSNHVHRLGIQLDVGRTNRVSNDVRMFVDWVRVSKYKAVA